MTVTDIATRTYNHGWRLDPIIRSLLDTDFYKLLMLQMIRQLHPDVNATFSLINRTTSVRLADIIDEKELRAQLDHARSVRFTKKELIWLAGNSFYGRARMFAVDHIGPHDRVGPATPLFLVTGRVLQEREPHPQPADGLHHLVDRERRLGQPDDLRRVTDDDVVDLVRGVDHLDVLRRLALGPLDRVLVRRLGLGGGTRDA